MTNFFNIVSLHLQLTTWKTRGWTDTGSNAGRAMSPHPILSRLTLGPTQPPVKWVLGFFVESRVAGG